MTRPPSLEGAGLARKARLLAPTLISPVAWALALGLSYVVEDFACAAAASAGATAPVTTIRVSVLAINAVLLVATVVAGALGRADLRRGRAPGGSKLEIFLGYNAVILAAIFAFGIVLIGAAPLVLEVCG